MLDELQPHTKRAGIVGAAARAWKKAYDKACDMRRVAGIAVDASNGGRLAAESDARQRLGAVRKRVLNAQLRRAVSAACDAFGDAASITAHERVEPLLIHGIDACSCAPEVAASDVALGLQQR